MTQPAWLARAVLYQIDVPHFVDANGVGLAGIAAQLDYLADLGVNALSLGRCFVAQSAAAVAPMQVDPRYGDEASFDALLEAAHARDIRVCVATAPAQAPPQDARASRVSVDSTAAPGIRDAWQRALEAWFDRGVDGVVVDGAGTASAHDPNHVAMHRQWRDLHAWMEATYRDRALLVAVGYPRIARDAGFAVETARSDDAYGGDALVTGPNAIAAVRSIGRVAQPRDADDLKALFTFLLTWPHVPSIGYGDEIGVHDGAPTVAVLRARRESLWHQVERLIYLRTTEADLASDAGSSLISAEPGHPLVYRRGATLIVALNPGLTTHVVVLPPLGDAAPVLEHHCHASHGANGWQVKIGARGYGVFSVR